MQEMNIKILIIICMLYIGYNTESRKHQRHFPEDFLFGSATSAYQVEGASNEDGFSNEVNTAGIKYYNNLINEMMNYNITPFVILYHWDLPQKIQVLGGFMNPLIAQWFEDYARIVFENFGDRVKHFTTFNEPRETCLEGYGTYFKAPALNLTAFGSYLCAKHLILAHANAYHAYEKDFKHKQCGQCGITISVHLFEPDTNSTEDLFATEIRKQSEWGLYTEPIFSTNGGFPQVFADRVANKSEQQGYPRSRLPQFTEEERLWVRGSYDFFGVNHYSAWVVSATKFKVPVDVPSQYDDVDVGVCQRDVWISSASNWLKKVPNSLYSILTDLHTKYGNQTFYVTENGWSTLPSAGLVDDDRIDYLRGALENVLDSIDDGINVKGYMAWSLIDNFEWMRGYSERFGLYRVDYTDPARTRTPRKSAFVYKHIVKHRYIDPEYEPDSMVMTIDEGH